MKKIGIIGATGYAGLELLRLLMTHKEVEIRAISSVSFANQTIDTVYPSMQDILPASLVDEDRVIERSDIVFSALPHGLSEPLAKKCDQQGKIYIDLGADFRLVKQADYHQWYGGCYQEENLHKKAVYGLSELFREEIKQARLIANPGCYPTAVALGLFPLLKEHLIDPMQIIIDAKSGVTGAGRSPSQNTHYPELNENMIPYQIAAHRHTPEIEQTLSRTYKKEVKVTFVPHLLPINRGILATMYVSATKDLSIEQLHEYYQKYYQHEMFVRLKPIGSVAALKDVKHSNYCDISLHCDQRTGRIVVVSVIDNMIKGAAGQAIQNMNLVCGFAEYTGLCMLPTAF